MINFWLCFVPLFVAVDAIGVLPMFISLTEGLERLKIRRIIVQSVLTAMLVALLFLAIGKFVLQFLGITVPDFMIAGGVLLFAISLSDLLSTEKKQRQVEPESLGAVPLGVPLIVGPAVLTTIIVLVNQYGIILTVISTLTNIILAGMVFLMSGSIIRILGKVGARVVSKIASLLLAAIAVMMIRKGIMAFI